tara:strand:+ start:23774 stop:24136 length:363 start_codon:yes stop_codon:yes gene_type:complete
MNQLKYFKLSEFDSPDAVGSGEMMEPEFLDMLDLARDIAGFPFIITSGFRSIAHNRAVRGVKNSSHMMGWAADLSCTSSKRRFLMVEALMDAGFTRIGIGSNFIHCDCDPNKTGLLIWTY